MQARGDDAVTAPLGVLLIIIIAVALAGGLFLFGKLLVDRNEEQKLVAVQRLQEDSALQVVQVNEELDWFEHIGVTGSCDPLLNGGPMPTAPGVPVRAGDVLDCEPGETLRLVHKVDNVVITDVSF